MTRENIESAVNKRPFRPFEIRIDGDTLRVDHPEQVMFVGKTENIVYLDRDEHIHLFEAEAVSKIRLIAKEKRKTPGASAQG